MVLKLKTDNGCTGSARDGLKAGAFKLPITHLVGTWQKRLAGTPVNYYYYYYYDPRHQTEILLADQTLSLSTKTASKHWGHHPGQQRLTELLLAVRTLTFGL